MREFRIAMDNRPGELARVTTPLSRNGVGIKALAVTTGENQVTLHLVGHDATAVRDGLEGSGIPFEEQDVALLLLEDKAGEIARISSLLAESGINITAIYLAGRAEDLVEVVVASDDLKKAKKLLSDYIT